MSTSHKRSKLHIYDADTRENLVQISSTLAKTSFVSSVPLEIEPALALKHADGDFPDVAGKLHDIDTEFVTRAATAKSQSDAVQASLTSKVNAINTDIGTFQSDLATEIALQQAAQTADADARTALETHLETQVDDEEALAKAAEEANALSITQLNTTRATQVAAEEDTRALAIANVQSQLDFAKANTDPAAVDSISELLNLMSGDPDSSVLALINDVRTDITAMQNVVNILTNDGSLGDQLVHSIELQEVPPHAADFSAGGDGIMNINEIQLWRLASDGTLTNVALSGTAMLVQGNADLLYAAQGGIESVNNGVTSIARGFQLHTVPISESPFTYNTHNYPANPYPIVRITLAAPVPLRELVSTVIFNRVGSQTSMARLSQDRVVLKNSDGVVVSNVQLPSVTKSYVRVDYMHAGTFSSHMTTDVAQADTKIVNIASDTLVV